MFASTYRSFTTFSIKSSKLDKRRIGSIKKLKRTRRFNYCKRR